MATRLFMENEGVVQRVILDRGTPASIQMLGEGGSSGRSDGIVGGGSAGIAIITSIAMNFATKHQILKTLGRESYLYSFGNELPEIVVSGLCFISGCDDNSELGGLQKILKFYKQNRLSENSGSTDYRPPVVQISVGSNTIKGYLKSLQIQIADPVSYIVPFAMQLSGVGDLS